MSRLTIHRPGALGDIICIIHASEEIYNLYGEFDLVVHPQSYSTLKAFVDMNDFKFKFHSSEEFKAKEATADAYLVGYPLDGDKRLRLHKHLVLYFAEELGIKKIKEVPRIKALAPPPPGDLVQDHQYVTIQLKTGWSQYKELSLEQNNAICRAIKAFSPYKIVQIGGKDEPSIPEADYHILGDTFERSLGAQAWAKHHIGPDSVFNHTTNFLWEHKEDTCKNLIYFGSTSPTGSGYSYNMNIFSHLHCQPCYRENPETGPAFGGPCPNNGMCLKAIPQEFLQSYIINLIK